MRLGIGIVEIEDSEVVDSTSKAILNDRLVRGSWIPTVLTIKSVLDRDHTVYSWRCLFHFLGGAGRRRAWAT